MMQRRVELKVEQTETADPTVPLPAYETEGAAGMDLRANFPRGDTSVSVGTRAGAVLNPGDTAAVPTGLRMEIPEGFEVQIRPRSGLAARHGVTVLNTPGTVDSDYRGEVKVILHNAGRASFAVLHGDRIAQMVVAPVARATLVEVLSLSETGRGARGFGSTGTD